MHTIAQRLCRSTALATAVLAGGAATAHATVELRPSTAGDGGVLAAVVDNRPTVVSLSETVVDGVPKIRMRLADEVRLGHHQPCTIAADGPATVVTCDRVGSAFHLSLGGAPDRLETDPAMTFPVHVNGGLGRDELTGGAGDDVLRGASGDDRIVGGLGRDTLVGEGDRDEIDARDGVPDKLVDCTFEDRGPTFAVEGIVAIDLTDPEPVDCTVVGRSNRREGPNVAVTRATLARTTLTVTFRCPSAARCSGQLRVRRGGRRVATARFRGAAGATSQATVRLGARTARQLRGGRGVVELVERGDFGAKTTTARIASVR